MERKYNYAQDGICYEECPECGAEVELKSPLGVYRCPECGKWIVNCSMCLALSDGMAVCSACPVAYEAEMRNRELEGDCGGTE